MQFNKKQYKIKNKIRDYIIYQILKPYCDNKDRINGKVYHFHHYDMLNYLVKSKIMELILVKIINSMI